MAKDEGDDLLPDKDAAKGFYAKYEPKEILGRGISSTVRRCIEKETGIEYAAKIIDISNETNDDGHTMKDATLQEVQILRRVAGHCYISSNLVPTNLLPPKTMYIILCLRTIYQSRKHKFQENRTFSKAFVNENLVSLTERDTIVLSEWKASNVFVEEAY